jgi:acetolactate synthase-1/2/3 large subunit
MAIGYAHVTGRPAVLLTSTGPGALNAFSALEDARWASLPLVHLTTFIDGREFRGAVHETPGQASLMRLVSKRSHRLRRGGPARVVATAVRGAGDAPAGPVSIEVRAGIWNRPVGPVRAEGAPNPAPEPAPPGRAELLRDLRGARRPVVFVGGGAVRADRGRAALALAERLGAPIVTSYQGKPVADWSHPLYLGPWAGEPRVQRLFSEADVGIVLGSKLSAVGTDHWRLPLPGCTYRVDAAPRRHPDYRTLLDVRGDAASVAADLAGELAPRPSWAAGQLAEIRSEVVAAARERAADEMEYIDAIAAALPAGTPVVFDMTKAGFWGIKYLPAREGAVHGFSSYLAMGSALPMAIGMSVGGGRPVTVVVGDGGLQMSVAEMATLAEYRLPVSVVVVVDGAYGLLRDNGIAVGGSRRVGVELWNPDHRWLGESYGISYAEASSPPELCAILTEPACGPRMIVVRRGFSRRW